MAAIPSLEAEDAKRPSRERENLVGERTRIGNRKHARPAWRPRLQTEVAHGRATARAAAHTGGRTGAAHTVSELRREMAGLRLLAEQIRETERARLDRLSTNPTTAPIR
jgi:transposase